MIDFHSGKEIGEHKGLWYHTIGQVGPPTLALCDARYWLAAAVLFWRAIPGLILKLHNVVHGTDVFCLLPQRKGLGQATRK